MSASFLLLGLMGIGGMCSAISGVAQNLGTPVQQTGIPAEAYAIQIEMMTSARQLIPVNILVVLLSLPLTIGLIAGSVGIMASAAWGKRVLNSAILYAFAVETIRILASLFGMWWIWDSLFRFTAAITAAQQGAGGMEGMVEKIVMGSLAVGIVFSLVWYAMKMFWYALGFYAIRLDNAAEEAEAA